MVIIMVVVIIVIIVIDVVGRCALTPSSATLVAVAIAHIFSVAIALVTVACSCRRHSPLSPWPSPLIELIEIVVYYVKFIAP
jgi:hypothetical protein